MRKPFYFTKRKLKSGKTSVSIVFNDFSSNRRLIFAASSLYKQYYKEAPEKLIAMPTEDCWRKSTLNTIALWAISSGLVSFEKCKGEEILFKDYAIKFWSFEESDYVARKNAEKKDSLHKTYVKDMLGVLRKHILSKLPEGLRLSDLEPSHAERIKDAMLKDGITCWFTKTV